MRAAIAVLLLLIAAAMDGAAQEAQTPDVVAPDEQKAAPVAPRDAAAPDSTARPLGIDTGKAIAEIVARMLATPRFQEQIEVRDRYQEALNSYVHATELGCGATESGPPAKDEMNRFRETRIPPHADLSAGVKWLYRKIKGQGAPKTSRYFLYSVRLKSAPERFIYVVRAGPISEDDRSSVPGTTWELVGRYADRAKAADALSRLQRGTAPPSGDGRGGPRVLWAAPDCRH